MIARHRCAAAPLFALRGSCRRRGIAAVIYNVNCLCAGATCFCAPIVIAEITGQRRSLRMTPYPMETVTGLKGVEKAAYQIAGKTESGAEAKSGHDIAHEAAAAGSVGLTGPPPALET